MPKLALAPCPLGICYEDTRFLIFIASDVHDVGPMNNLDTLKRNTIVSKRISSNPSTKKE